MSQQQSFNSSSIPSTPNIQFLQGNDSVPVGPDPTTHIIKLIGDTVQGVSVTNTAPNQETITIDNATTSQIGVTSLATNAETIAGTVTTKATTPDDIKAKLGVQTLHGLAYGGGTTAALNWLAEASNGQIPIGSTGNAPVLGNITSLDGTVTVINGAGTIDLSTTPNYTNVTNAMSPYTAISTDYFISVDASAGPVTIKLPDAPSFHREFIIKDRLGQAFTNNITITSVSGSTTFDGMANYFLADNFESVDLLYSSGNYETF